MFAEVHCHTVKIVVHGSRVHAVFELGPVLFLELFDVRHVASVVHGDPVSVDSVLHLALIIKLFKYIIG